MDCARIHDLRRRRHCTSLTRLRAAAVETERAYRPTFDAAILSHAIITPGNLRLLPRLRSAPLTILAVGSSITRGAGCTAALPLPASDGS